MKPLEVIGGVIDPTPDTDCGGGVVTGEGAGEGVCTD